MQALVGRDGECAVIAELDNDGDLVALVLTGEAGIGKTTLWNWAVRRARDAGDHVLVSHATAAEATLPWVALTDLLRSIPDTVVDALPSPQSSALRAVSLQATVDGPVDERVVGTALVSTLNLLTASAPVSIAIDDITHADAASTRALAFALRRAVGDRRVRLVATARGDGSDVLARLDLPDASVEAIEVGPLTVGALFEVLSGRTAARLTRPVLLRVHETSGGNPMYAMELARALDRLEIKPRPSEPLSVPASLGALVDARIREVPSDVRGLVAATAAAWRFLATDDDSDAIDAALAADLVVVDQPAVVGEPAVVRAAHPLLAAAAYGSLSRPERYALHRRLAALTADPVERARHLALAASSPREDVAEALDAGAAAALAAGVPDVAADLLQLAVQHTEDAAARPVRLGHLADARFRAGDMAGAVEAQRAVVDMVPVGPLRARARTRLAAMVTEHSGWVAAEADAQTAVTEAGDDPTTLAEALLTLAAITDDIARADASAVRAVELLDSLDEPDPVILSGALDQAAGSRFRAGRGLDHAMFERAIAIERAHPFRRLSDRADASYAALLKYADEIDEAERRLTALLAEARASGDLTSIAFVLSHLVPIALWTGRLAEGRALGEEHWDVATQGQLLAQLAQARYTLGLAMAHQGALDDSESVVRPLLDDPSASEWERHRAHAVLGFVALSRGDALTASAHLDEWYRLVRGMHLGEPGYSRSHLDYASALVATGRLDDADEFIAGLERQVERSGRESAGAIALAGRALLAAAAGDTDGARTTIARALAWFEASPLRFDHARMLLTAGQISRRARAKADARDLLDAARRQFEAFGASAWEARAAAESRRVNVRPRAPATLTEAERRVADLAAAGLTNRDIAARLFLSTKTVEANLSRAYRKLGIRSRAELGLRLRAIYGS